MNNRNRFAGVSITPSCLIVLLLVVGIGYGQDYRARVQGLVTDTSQAVVAGAKITLRNVNTGVTTSRLTSPSGTYVIDFVEPGTYTITVEAEGFNRFVQQNILVQNRGDVTVDAQIKVGSVSETINVVEAPIAIQFNSSTRDLTIDRKMVTELPLITRNPFKLAALDPGVVSTSGSEISPYHHWAANQIDAGGSTGSKNDLLIDGTPLETGPKTAYTPPMDSVTEFTIQQNSVDAEFGHSAGGIMSLSMKSGTNEYHGSLYYLGRNPALNSMTDRITRAKNRVRNHIFGGSIGNPIIKNKFFNFFTYEAWRTIEPATTWRTAPTDLERTGDFSQSLNINGGLRSIFDPFSTVFDPGTGKVMRTPFPGNKIPSTRLDPLAVKIMPSIWSANNPGDNITAINNSKYEVSRRFNYWNLSDRADWNITEKWKVFGRYSQFHTIVTENNPTPNNSEFWPYEGGSTRHGLNIGGDAVYTMSPTTVINLRFAYSSIIDAYNGGDYVMTPDQYAGLWPNKWFEPYLKEVPQILHPQLNVEGAGAFGHGGYWYQRPKNISLHGRVSKYLGGHYLKGGIETRFLRGYSVRPDLAKFYFNKALTADTFISPNTKVVGDGWASFLIGALDNTSIARNVPMQRARFNSWAGYIQDDYKLTQRITLNLGLRYEYETAPYDPEDRISRYLDLNNPIPEMQATPPAIPADVASMMKVPYQFNGAWIFADSSNRGMWASPRNTLLPRVGVAFKVNNKTAIRAGWARYAIPPIYMIDTLGSMYMPGFNADSYTLPVLEGIPQARFYDPFPTGSNPLTVPTGKGYGRYTNLGNLGDSIWAKQDLRNAINERFNFSVQRELFSQIVLDVTYFLNFGYNWAYTQQMNQMDPTLSYTYKAVLDQKVDNPFYKYLTPDKFPGQLRNQAQVTKASLLKPYPQYGNLPQINTDGVHERYQALQFRVQRPFARGFNLLFAYNYNKERTEQFFNSDDQYIDRLSYVNSANPRHRIMAAGVYELPFGKGRPLLANLHPVLDAVIGGWQTSGIFTYVSGSYLTFGQLNVSGDPVISGPTSKRWFDTSVFTIATPYTPRTNPILYDGLVGPRYLNWDGTLAKSFPLKERFRLEVRLEAYNVTNSLMLANPDTSVTSSMFGQTNSLRALTAGRQVQYNFRIYF